MMKALFLLIPLAVAACSTAPSKFSSPPADAPVWNLNTGRLPGTNDLIHEPNWKDADAAR
jgi:hypothetical protein